MLSCDCHVTYIPRWVSLPCTGSATLTHCHHGGKGDCMKQAASHFTTCHITVTKPHTPNLPTLFQLHQPGSIRHNQATYCLKSSKLTDKLRASSLKLCTCRTVTRRAIQPQITLTLSKLKTAARWALTPSWPGLSRSGCMYGIIYDVAYLRAC